MRSTSLSLSDDARLAGLPRIEDPGELSTRDARELSKAYFQCLKTLEPGTHAYSYVRDTLIRMNLSLVRYAVRRFRKRGDAGDVEDLMQVGTIGLIKAIDRFDPDRGIEFATLALPYITGEIKRHFRDTTWAVRVPRRLQELRIDLAKGKEELTALLGRSPTVRDLAEHLNLSEDEVVEGLVAANGHTSSSLDAPQGGHAEGDAARDGRDGPRSLAEVMGQEQADLELVEDIQTLAPLLEQLDERERRLLRLRFGEEMTQAQIGAELELSQMHVSRLLTRTLGRLREGMLAA
ncbi:SigB/SigF/SigG family RNA polymerase sigma factor [Streptomyces sp. NPDC051211]|uniref:SigB/SigF/SigG family RNA polymerase sigma factor n=1 Tax=Streptomyces sp. NPDC051211 TaxID=3154643 RepID=UPI003450447B